MTFTDLLSLANSEQVFTILFILTLVFAGRWLRTFLAEQNQENNERERYIMKTHEEQLKELREEKKETQEQMKTMMQEHRATLHEQRQDSLRREAELMGHLNKTAEQMDEVISTLQTMKDSLNSMDREMQNGFDEIWQKIRDDKE